MKKTTNVNLNGRVFTMDEDAYQLLDNYIRNLQSYFRKEEDSAEIVADFEARIEELFSEKNRLGYQVINVSHVEEVIVRVGKPDDFSSDEDKKENEKQSTANQEEKSAKKKFFRNSDDKLIGGVCSGISAYFGWDVLPIRIIFVLLIFFTTLGFILVYLIIWALSPEARTAEQKLQMHGKPITVENIGKTVAAEIDKSKSNENPGCIGGFIHFVGSFLKVCFVGLAGLIGIPILFAFALVALVLLAVLFGSGETLIDIPFSTDMYLTFAHPRLAIITFCIVLLIPLVALIYGVVSYFAKLKPLNVSVKRAGLLIWVIALILFLCSGYRITNDLKDIHNRWIWQGDLIEGNGILSEKTYPLSPVDYISVERSFVANLKIEQVPGDSASITLSGDENIVDEIRYKTDGSKLRLSMYKDRNTRLKTINDLIVTVQVPSLKKIKTLSSGNTSLDKSFVTDELEIKSEGVGKFSADSLAVKKINVDWQGVGSIKLAGTARNTTLRAKGVGNIDALNLVSDSVAAYVEGVASIRCNPTKYLKGRLNGVGNIEHKNDPPQKDIRIQGLGKVKSN